jgi:hypothetical protein
LVIKLKIKIIGVVGGGKNKILKRLVMGIRLNGEWIILLELREYKCRRLG